MSEAVLSESPSSPALLPCEQEKGDNRSRDALSPEVLPSPALRERGRG